MEEQRYKLLKLRLLPTKSQEKKMWVNVHNTRAIKNIYIARCFELLDQNKGLNKYELTKELTQMKKDPQYHWLLQTSRKTLCIAINDVYESFIRYFKKISGRPKFKKKKDFKNSFGIRDDLPFFKLDNNKLKVEKIGSVKIAYNSLKNNLCKLKKIEEIDKLRETRIRFDGKFWYAYITYRDDLIREKSKQPKQSKTIGVDLGIKSYFVTSDGLVIDNINKTQKVKSLEKKIKRLQRKLSKQYLMNKSGNAYIETKNIVKTKQKLVLYYRKLTNIRENYIHQSVNQVINSMPKRIVVEDMRSSLLVKNRNLAKSILDAKFYQVKQRFKEKCLDNEIELILAHPQFPATQLCSSCGSRKQGEEKLRLRDRVYKCTCGLVLDRDLNAALNLANYTN